MNSKTALKKLRELVNEVTYGVIMTQLSDTTVYFPSNTEFPDLEERNLQIKDDFYRGGLRGTGFWRGSLT